MATNRSAAVREAALRLPLKERARLAHELLISLEGSTDEDVERAWIEEAERRWYDVRAGRAEFFDAGAVLREAEQITKASARPRKRKTSTRRR